MPEDNMTVQDNSKERVAFDLMNKIYSGEYEYQKPRGDGQERSYDRKYFLTLYCQCLKATRGFGLDSALKED